MWEREAPTSSCTSDKLIPQYDRTVQQNNPLIEVYDVLKLNSEFLGFATFPLVKLLYACKTVGRLGKAAHKRQSQIDPGCAEGYFWR